MLVPNPLTLLLVPPVGLADIHSSYDCLVRSYYGLYGTQHAFIIDETCRLSSFSIIDLGTPVLLRPNDLQTLIWVELGHTASSHFVHFDFELQKLLGDLTAVSSGTPSLFSDTDAGNQVFWTPAQPGFYVLHGTQNEGALLSASEPIMEALEQASSHYWRSTRFPTSPRRFYPVPARTLERLRALLPTLRYNHKVASVVNGISLPRLRKDIRYLTGEDIASEIVSRHSFSEGARLAATWIKSQIERTGASCQLKFFQEGFSPNIICDYPASSNSTETIVLGSHYDSVGSFGSVRAPGANDNGSGTGALIAIARAIARKGVIFEKRVQLCAFAGEEQVMVGSRAHAKELREQGADVLLMVQADMLAFHVNGEPPQLGISDPEFNPRSVANQILANVSAIYSPELTTGYAPRNIQSDHLSFYDEGFPATMVYERAGEIMDTSAHTSGDVSEREGYDFEQVKSIAKVELAMVLHLAGFAMKEPQEEIADR